MGQTGYQIGAYGQLSMDTMISAWIAVTATLVVLMLVPTNKQAKLRAHIWILAIPSVWIIGRLVVVALWGSKALLHPAFYMIGVVSYALCVPYAIYLIVRIANPDLPLLREARLRLFLVIVAAFFCSAGYGIGLKNELFMSCDELKLHDKALPDHCVDTGLSIQKPLQP